MSGQRRLAALVQRSQGKPRPVSPRIDELAEGTPGPAAEPNAATAEALAKVRRNPDGSVADPASAAELGRLGGLAKAERDRRLAETPHLVRVLGMRGVSAVDFQPYLPDAEEFAAVECERLARTVGGGECGNAPSSFVQSAALQLAGSRFSFARGDLVTGSRLADAARSNLLAAHELCAREAEHRTDDDSGSAWWQRGGTGQRGAPAPRGAALGSEDDSPPVEGNESASAGRAGGSEA